MCSHKIFNVLILQPKYINLPVNFFRMYQSQAIENSRNCHQNLPITKTCMCVTMKDASPPQNNDHQQETNDYLPRVTNNCKTQNPKIEVKYNGNNDSEEDVKSDKTKDNIQKRDASSKTQLRKSYKPSIKRTDFPIVKPDAITHYYILVKCIKSDVTHVIVFI